MVTNDGPPAESGNVETGAVIIGGRSSDESPASSVDGRRALRGPSAEQAYRRSDAISAHGTGVRTIDNSQLRCLSSCTVHELPGCEHMLTAAAYWHSREVQAGCQPSNKRLHATPAPAPAPARAPLPPSAHAGDARQVKVGPRRAEVPDIFAVVVGPRTVIVDGDVAFQDHLDVPALEDSIVRDRPTGESGRDDLVRGLDPGPAPDPDDILDGSDGGVLTDGMDTSHGSEAVNAQESESEIRSLTKEEARDLDRARRSEKTAKILVDADRRDVQATARDAVSDERARVADREAFRRTGSAYPGQGERRAAALDRADSKRDRESSADDRAQLLDDEPADGSAAATEPGSSPKLSD